MGGKVLRYVHPKMVLNGNIYFVGAFVNRYKGAPYCHLMLKWSLH